MDSCPVIFVSNEGQKTNFRLKKSGGKLVIDALERATVQTVEDIGCSLKDIFLGVSLIE